MTNKSILERLGVCSWSLQPSHPGELIAHLETIGIKRMQCALDPLRSDPATWGALAGLCRQHGVEIISGMFGTIGEDYSTLESIRRTGGLVPDAGWDENWRNFQAAATLAQQLGLKLVSFHAGFLPHDSRDPEFAKLLDRARKVARLFAERGIILAFETGQESAETLRAFLQVLDMPNVGVNFDPANMILYDKGDPVEALRILGPWLRHCHIKDATRTKVPGTWGEEVVVGTGEVNWSAFFRTLRELNFTGNCCIEREAGQQRVKDIRAAREAIIKFSQE